MKKKRRLKKRWYFLIALVIVIIIILIFLYKETGFLQKADIDKKDLTYWKYNNGIINNTEGFILSGKNTTCWYFIHGYTSTPDELREEAVRLNDYFNETIIVPRLIGHGEVPSHVINFTLKDWYDETKNDISKLDCDRINVLGGSYGGTIALKLIEDKTIKIDDTYLLAPYIKPTYNPLMVISPNTLIYYLADRIIYEKKAKIGQINSIAGLKKHIAYWNFPYQPVKYSLDLIEDIEKNLSKINSPVLIFHSKNDKTADFKASKKMIDEISSKNKQLIVFEKSNHILAEDYDKDTLIQDIIDFEDKIRDSS